MWYDSNENSSSNLQFAKQTFTLYIDTKIEKYQKIKKWAFEGKQMKKSIRCNLNEMAVKLTTHIA